MNDSRHTLRIEREDEELLLVDGLALVRSIIEGDPSAQPGGYDSLAGKGDVARITEADVTAINQTMRARSGHKYWQQTYGDPQEWLTALGPGHYITEPHDRDWAAARGDEVVLDAIAACLQPGIGLAGATKVLHLKRPRLFPVLDSLVVQMMGINVGDEMTRAQRIAVAQRVTAAIRREGRRNIDALRAIQGEVIDGGGISLTLVRILDICLWFAHPAAGVPGARREMHVRVR
jgi:hypothetical protein